LGEGAQHLKQDELKSIQNQIQQIKNQYKGVEAIEEASYDLADIKGQTALLLDKGLPWLIGAGENYIKNRGRLGVANLALSTGQALANAGEKQRMGDKQYNDWRRHYDPGYGKTADVKLGMTGNEEWGDLSDPNNPLGPSNNDPEPSNDYGFDNSGGFIGEGWAQGGRVGYSEGGLATLWPK